MAIIFKARGIGMNDPKELLYIEVSH